MRFVSVVLAAALLAGCGYVGDPLPPALNIPVAVTDLRVVQRGDKLVLDFTAPELTTDEIVLTNITALSVLIGEDRAIATPPKPGTPAHVEIPVRQWVGREAPVRVVLAGPKGQESVESNSVMLRILEPVGTPTNIQAEPHPEGIRVSWTATAPTFRVTRDPAAEATVDKPEFVDRAVEMDKEYKYTVTAVSGTAESVPAAPVSVTARDRFAPSVPANINAVAGVNSIELTWERNTEADMKSYRVYRDDVVIGQDVEAPAFSDKQTMAGQRYRYAVSAIDQRGNESAKSAAVEITAP
jgi:hypothetical protein